MLVVPSCLNMVLLENPISFTTDRRSKVEGVLQHPSRHGGQEPKGHLQPSGSEPNGFMWFSFTCKDVLQMVFSSDNQCPLETGQNVLPGVVCLSVKYQPVEQTVGGVQHETQMWTTQDSSLMDELCSTRSCRRTDEVQVMD